MQVEDDVVAVTAQIQAQAEIGGQPRQPLSPRCDDHGIECRVVTDDGGRRGLDQVGEVGVRERTAECAERRRREDHVADEAEPYDEHAHGGDYRPQPERRR